MNTSKQINAMIVLLLFLLMLVGAYTIWDPFRAEATDDRTREEMAARAAATFARNCRQCHGNDGEGRIGPPLNPEVRARNESLLPFADPNRAGEMQQIVTDTISCGRIGTIMPPWSQEHGGALNAEQIRQLVLLITNPPPGAWEEVAADSAAENQTAALPEIQEVTAGASVTGANAYVCGQKAPEEEEETGPVEVKTEWDQVATDNKFSVTRMGIPANQPVVVRFRNDGAALHNWHVLDVQSAGGGPITTELLPGGQSATVNFEISTPGTYNFHCDVHPTEMKGTIVVQ